MVMDRSKYHLGYKFKDTEIFPVQDNVSDGTHLTRDSVVIAMKQADLEGLPDAMIIYRPDMDTNFISLMEIKAFSRSKLPKLIIRNNKGESSIFTAKNIQHENSKA